MSLSGLSRESSDQSPIFGIRDFRLLIEISTRSRALDRDVKSPHHVALVNRPIYRKGAPSGSLLMFGPLGDPRRGWNRKGHNEPRGIRV